MSCIIHRVTRDSHTLLNVNVRLMGRSLSSEGVGIALGTGIITACFHWFGAPPERRDELNMSQAGIPISKAKRLRMILGTP